VPDIWEDSELPEFPSAASDDDSEEEGTSTTEAEEEDDDSEPAQKEEESDAEDSDDSGGDGDLSSAETHTNDDFDECEVDDPAPPCGSKSKKASPDPKKKTFIEIEMVDEEGNPVADESYEVTLADGSVTDGSLDDKGQARIEGLDPGNCQITFPDLDKDAWSAK